MNNSPFFSLNWQDLAKGLLLAVITAFVVQLEQQISSGAAHLPTLAELKADGLIALAAGLSYLIKNFISNSSGQPLKKEQ